MKAEETKKIKKPVQHTGLKETVSRKGPEGAASGISDTAQKAISPKTQLRPKNRKRKLLQTACSR